MNKKSLLLLVFFLATSLCQAQIAISIKAEKNRNLVFEPIKVAVRMENFTGNTLSFPIDLPQPSLYFEISNSQGKKITTLRKQDDPVGGLVFLPGRVVARELVINNIFDMRFDGTYNITAFIRHPLMAREYKSNTIRVQVDAPPVITSYKVGLPLQPGDTMLRKRTYSILLFESEKGAQYYMRLEDDKHVFKSVPLTMKKTNYPPVFTIDAQSHLHSLIYTAPTLFEYIVIDTDGELVKKEIYKANETSPKLYKDPDLGRVIIIGGTQAREGIDFLSDDMNRRREQQPAPKKEPANAFEEAAIRNSQNSNDEKVEMAPGQPLNIFNK
ncbi:MAG: hypothetical protein ACRC37_08340 [Lentisphaeria bacterium]